MVAAAAAAAIAFLSWQSASRLNVIEAQRADIARIERTVAVKDAQINAAHKAMVFVQERARRAEQTNTHVSTIIERAANATPDEDDEIADVLSNALSDVDSLLRQ